jgi:hypothetical protein
MGYSIPARRLGHASTYLVAPASLVISRGALSVALSDRPTAPKTVSTSGRIGGLGFVWAVS